METQKDSMRSLQTLLYGPIGARIRTDGALVIEGSAAQNDEFFEGRSWTFERENGRRYSLTVEPLDDEKRGPDAPDRRAEERRSTPYT